MASSTAPSATRQCCQKSPKPRLDQAAATRASQPAGMPRGEVVEITASSSRATAETWIRSPAATPPLAATHAPSPRSAHQRRPSAGAEMTATSTRPPPLEREQRRPHRDAANVVLRPVDRIDDPAHLAAVVASLLAEHALPGPFAGDERPDRLLGRTVRLRHRRQIGLRLHPQVESAKPPERDRVRGVRRPMREGEIGAHARDGSRFRQPARRQLAGALDNTEQASAQDGTNVLSRATSKWCRLRLTMIPRGAGAAAAHVGEPPARGKDGEREMTEPDVRNGATARTRLPRAARS